MSDLLVAAGLVLALEGALYALFPDFMRRVAAQAVEMTPDTLRTGGVIAVCLGVFLVWLVRT
jgi:uncharacterized protein YjeT (DUF2065 family)